MPRLACLAAILLAPAIAGAQTPVPIGTTATGNAVLLEPKSVKRDGARVTAAVRVRFGKGVRTADGEMRSSRTIATWDCAAKQVAVAENWYYRDEAGTQVGSHRKVGQPGYATTIGGSMTAVALAHLCTAK